MLRYEGPLGDLDIELTVPTGDRHKDGEIVFWFETSTKGEKAGYGTKVNRIQLLEFAEMIMRIV